MPCLCDALPPALVHLRPQELCITDTFPAFARKVLQAVEGVPKANQVKHLQQRMVKFNNAPVNKNMLEAVRFFEDKIDGEGSALLSSIDRLHGREVLTATYT